MHSGQGGCLEPLGIAVKPSAGQEQEEQTRQAQLEAAEASDPTQVGKGLRKGNWCTGPPEDKAGGDHVVCLGEIRQGCT